MSITLPLFVILIPYGIFLLAYLILSIVSLHNLIHYAANSIISFFITFLFLAATTIILFITYELLLTIDWSTGLTIPIPNFWPESI